jgi:3',5'-cyclic AMP phosphodiesterase CpdA
LTVLLQVSDPHFGTERPEVVEALVQLAHSQRPDVLMLSGDITQRGTRAQYAAARAFVDRLEVPTVLAIPGNHDIPLFNLAVRLLAPYAQHQRAFGAQLEPSLDQPGLLLLTVNTTRRYRHVDGTVSRRQREHIAERLRKAGPSQVRIVVTHQPVSVTRAEDEHNLLHGHALAVHEWAAAGADLVLGGHIHLPFVHPLHEHVEGVTRPCWAVQAGTAVSHRVRHEAGNSVNLLRLGCAPVPADEQPGTVLRRCTVERWDHQADAAAFRCVGQWPLRLGQPTAVS